MAKLKSNSIIFACKDNSLSQSILNSLDKLDSQFDNKIEIIYFDDIKSRVDLFSNKGTVVFAVNFDYDELLSKVKYNDVTCLAPKIYPYYLTHFEKINLIGFQRHLIDRSLLIALEANQKSNISLGLLTQQPALIEPIVRNSQLINVDFTSIKSSELQDPKFISPFGLTTEQMIQFIKTAGYSESLQFINIEVNEDLESNPLIPQLISSAFWYFVESREEWSRSLDDRNSIHHVVMHPDTGDFVHFYQVEGAQQFWFINDVTQEKSPCSSDEFVKAVNEGVITDRITSILLMDS